MAEILKTLEKGGVNVLYNWVGHGSDVLNNGVVCLLH